jgi:hypothetical protein
MAGRSLGALTDHGAMSTLASAVMFAVLRKSAVVLSELCANVSVALVAASVAVLASTIVFAGDEASSCAHAVDLVSKITAHMTHCAKCKRAR